MMALALLPSPAAAQSRRLWVLRPPGELVEYTPGTFAVKQRVKIPPEALQSPQNISVNRLGQILFASPASLPLSQEDAEASHKIWFWNGHVATTFEAGVKREVGGAGSNQAVTEIAPVPYLSADGAHLYWFANQARRLQREDVDLSTETTWQAWRTDLSGAGREDLASAKFPDCRCKTGTCDESCPYGAVWAPESGVDTFFLVTQFVAGKNGAVYKATSRYTSAGGKWNEEKLSEPLQRVLDAASGGNVILEAIPDTGCCGWSNQSDDKTLLLVNGKSRPAFDELETYKNPDYDVSFYTSIAKVSPDAGHLAMNIVSTTQANKPIQLAEDGQASQEEMARIRKALAVLPAVQVQRAGDVPGNIAFLPHATLIGWISETELLIVEDHVLVEYNVATKAKKRSAIKVDDAAKVFLR